MSFESSLKNPDRRVQDDPDDGKPTPPSRVDDSILASHVKPPPEMRGWLGNVWPVYAQKQTAVIRSATQRSCWLGPVLVTKAKTVGGNGASNRQGF